jgi:putative transposase
MEGPQLTVDIRVDESNLGDIHVLWPKTSAVFRVPALDQRYASGLSLFAHKVNRREQRGRADLDQGQAGRSQAQQEILKRIEEDRGRKKLTNRAQRYLEGTPAKEEDAKLSQQSAPTNTRTPSSPARIPLLKERGRPKSATSLVEAHEDDDLPTFIATRKDHPNAG